jgi:hypothetical protein
MVLDRHVDVNAKIAKELVTIALVTAVSQTGVVSFKYTPGFRFRVVRVVAYCRVKAGAAAGVLKVGTRTAVTTVGFTTATENLQTLSTTIADLVGSAAEALSLEYTTDGSGVLTNGFVIVEIRPIGLKGEVDG